MAHLPALSASSAWQHFHKTRLIASAEEIGSGPFFCITFVPDWEGLLRLFEATGERRYLDAAAAPTVSVAPPDGAPSRSLRDGRLDVVVPARGLAVRRLDGVQADVATHHLPPPATAAPLSLYPCQRQPASTRNGTRPPRTGVTRLSHFREFQ